MPGWREALVRTVPARKRLRQGSCGTAPGLVRKLPPRGDGSLLLQLRSETFTCRSTIDLGLFEGAKYPADEECKGTEAVASRPDLVPAKQEARQQAAGLHSASLSLSRDPATMPRPAPPDGGITQTERCLECSLVIRPR